jgi:antibiotic biosynthesis monooxygenase (ABM) superfamily enzyme
MATVDNIVRKRNVTNPASPPRYKIALLTWAGVFTLLTAANVVFGPLLALLPLPARTLLLTGLVVGLMTYIVMPRLTRWCAGWLISPSGARSQDENVPSLYEIQP